MKYILSSVLLMIGVQAHAGFLVEPFVGYDTGTNKTTDLSAVDSTGGFSGTNFGARLGYQFSNGLSIAGEYAGGSGTLKADSTIPTAKDSTYTRAATGVVVGYVRGMFKMYFGYGLSDTFTEKANAADITEDAKLTGTNYKVGLGVMPIRHFAVSLEYSVPKYTKISTDTLTAAGAADSISTYFTKFDTSMTTLSLSFPFDLGGK